MAGKSVTKNALLQKDFLAVIIVVVNAFSWYFPSYIFLESILGGFQGESTLLSLAFGVQLVVIVGSAIMGTSLLRRFSNRDIFLCAWMFVGIIASVTIITLETFKIEFILLVSLLSGISLGFGFPSCLAYFGDYGVEEKRGWLAGITFFASGLGILFIGLIITFSTIFVGALILAAWRGIGLLLFLLARSDKDCSKESAIEVSYRSVLLDRSFLLYLVPWTMFSLINFLEAPILTVFLGENIASFVPISEFGIGGFAALIGGWFADSVGRKRVVIFGFIILGIGYAALGLLPTITLSWYLYIILDGIAWGIFSLMFYLVIWSELAGTLSKEKYYLIGVLPYLISSYVQKLFTPYAELVPVSAAFSLASFFLFLAILPLIYAPETLPERKMELKRLRKYVEKAKQIEEKHKKN